MINSCKVLVYGRDGVGKTCYIATLRNAPFQPRYLATLDDIETSMTFYTTLGLYTITFVDCAGQSRHLKIYETHKHKLDAAIVMVDVGSKADIIFKTGNAFRIATKHHKAIPYVVVGNKSDGILKQSPPYYIKPDETFYSVSVRKHEYLYDPIDYLLRTLHQNAIYIPQILNKTEYERFLYDVRRSCEVKYAKIIEKLRADHDSYAIMNLEVCKSIIFSYIAPTILRL